MSKRYVANSISSIPLPCVMSTPAVPCTSFFFLLIIEIQKFIPPQNIRYQNSNQGLRGNAKSAFGQDDILDNLDSLVKMALKKSIGLSLKHEIRKTILLLEQAGEICHSLGAQYVTTGLRLFFAVIVHKLHLSTNIICTYV